MAIFKLHWPQPSSVTPQLPSYHSSPRTQGRGEPGLGAEARVERIPGQEASGERTIKGARQPADSITYSI